MPVRGIEHARAEPQDLLRRGLIDAGELQRRQPRGGKGTGVTGPGRSDDDDRVRRGPAGHEGEHFLALRVEPLHIVGQDGDRLVRRDRGEHVNRGQRDEEGFGWGAFLEPERRQQRPAMRRV